jgi:hypothetical protein
LQQLEGKEEMTHYESIDPDKVKEIFAKFFTIDKRTGEIRTCNGLECVDCLFRSADSDDSCRVGKMKWLDQPAFDPEKDIDWSKVPVDTPVIVWNVSEKCKRYFSKKLYHAGFDFETFANGKTSWTAEGCEYEGWPHCNLYRPEDIEKYRKKEAEKAE